MTEQKMVQLPETAARTLESAASRGKEKIVKVGVNHCKVQRILKDEAGEDVAVSEFEFGGDYVYSQLAQVETLLAQWKDPKWVEQRISELEAQKSRVLALKAVLEGV